MSKTIAERSRAKRIDSAEQVDYSEEQADCSRSHSEPQQPSTAAMLEQRAAAAKYSSQAPPIGAVRALTPAPAKHLSVEANSGTTSELPRSYLGEYPGASSELEPWIA